MLIRAHHPRCLVSCIPHPRLLSQKLYNNRDKSPAHLTRLISGSIYSPIAPCPYHTSQSLAPISGSANICSPCLCTVYLLPWLITLSHLRHTTRAPNPRHTSTARLAIAYALNLIVLWLGVIACYVRSVNYCSACVVACCACFAPCFLYVIAPYCYVGTIYQSHW